MPFAFNAKRLYLIGNGFDLHHGLPSTYNDFEAFVEKKDPSLSEIIGCYFDYGGEFWHAIEENLHYLDEKELTRSILRSLGRNRINTDNIEDCLPTIELYTVGAFHRLKDYMIDWVRGLNKLPISGTLLNIDPDAIYISFNYTDTLERHYHIHPSRIHYIHGNGERENCDLIFGHDMSTSEINYKPMYTHKGFPGTVLKSYLEYTRKPVERILKDQRNLWRKLSSVTEVIVLGHSLSVVDAAYFKRIAKRVPKDCAWSVSYHTPEEAKRHIYTLDRYGIDRPRVKLFEMDALGDR